MSVSALQQRYLVAKPMAYRRLEHLEDTLRESFPDVYWNAAVHKQLVADFALVVQAFEKQREAGSYANFPNYKELIRKLMAKQGYDIIYPDFMSKCKAQMWENLGV